MSAETEIRTLDRGDLDGLLALYRQLHTDDAIPARPEQIWERIVRDPDLIYVGGFAGGVLVSACNAAVIPNLTRGARPYALIENVITHAEYRRRGIGSAVIRDLVARCLGRGCYKIMLMSGAARAEAHRFYESLGFDRNAEQAFVIRVR
jgi:GNAT superfamily N-acetyltransferase